MPTTAVDFSFINTPPSAITPATAGAPISDNAGAVDVDMDPIALAPGVIDPPFEVGTEDEPESISPGFPPPSNAAAQSITPGTGDAFTSDNAGAVDVDMDPIALAPGVIDPPFEASTDDEPESISPGYRAPSNAAAQPITEAPVVPALSDENMHTSTFYCNGRLTSGLIFGLYVAPAPVVIRGVQLAAQTAPQGADAEIELVDADGITLGRTAKLPAGEKIANVIFETPLPITASTIVQAKVVGVGSSTPGGYLQATLVVQLTS